MKLCRWLKPRIVVAIDFLEWTLDDRLRHEFFVEQRKDLAARSVVRE
jgi:ATP-dependent DNA ligase